MFTPSYGLWSQEDFSDPTGFDIDNPSKQGVTGGFMTLLPSLPVSSGYFHKWAPVSGWTINNKLNTRTSVENTFSTYSSGVGPQYTNSPSGYQKTASDGGSWEVYTPPVKGTGSNVSGKWTARFQLDDTSPDTSFYDSLASSVNPFTIEVDVASVYSIGSDTLSGIPSGSLSGLPPLSGIINHGIYISNGPNWDYIEVRPDGVRSLNHPELYLPMDLKQPKRLRIGVSSTDIYIFNEDGHGVAGIGKFDGTGAPTNKPRLAFGAPLVGDDFRFSSDVVTFEGRTFWSNVKVLTGEMALDIPSGAHSYFSTNNESGRTPSFNAGIPLKEWSSAVITYVPYGGGTTTVQAQYKSGTSSGTYEWIDGPSVVLPNSGSVAYLDMTTVPASIKVPLSGASGSQSIYSSQPLSEIRFQIVQSSSAGTDLPPAVDNIFVQGSMYEPYLDMSPGWKPSIRSGDVKLFIKTGTFKSTKPSPIPDDQVFLSLSGDPGTPASGSVYDLSPNRHTGSVVGTGEIVAGLYDTAFQTYYKNSVTILSGTDASKELGVGKIKNVLPDPGFEKPFKDVSSDPKYSSSYTFGEIGYNCSLPADYTGGVKITFEKTPVVKAGPAATNYAQKIALAGPAPDAHQGLELHIPSGALESGKVGIFTASIRYPSGGEVAISASGDLSLPTTYIPVSGEDFRKISVRADITDSGEAWVKIAAKQGEKASFSFDDVGFYHISSGHLTYDNVSLPTHLFGHIGTLFKDWVNVAPPAQPYRACTVFSMDLFLEEYPDTEGILFDLQNNGTGVVIKIDSNGRPIADFDVSHNAVWEGGYTGTYSSIFNLSQPASDIYLHRQQLTGESSIPLGKWTNIGFIHESHAHRRFGGRGASGQIINQALAATNRAYLLIDGMPVASDDTLKEWVEQVYKAGIFDANQNLLSELSGVAVVPTFITNVTGTATIMSGVVGRAENVRIARPPAADAEAAIYIDAARVGVPYYVPDVFLKPGSDDQFVDSVLAPHSANSGTMSPGSFAQSIWPLDNPGPYTNWDHGATRNHLLFYGGVVKKSRENPYSGAFGSTYFPSDTGSYGEARYCSSLERFINSRESWTGLHPLGRTETGYFAFGGWIKADTTGEFFTFVLDSGNFDGHRLSLELKDGTTLGLTRYNTTSPIWSATATSSTALTGDWVHLGAEVFFTAYTGAGQVGSTTGTLYINGSGTPYSFTSVSEGGFDYRGNTQDTETSVIHIGRKVGAHLCDLFIYADLYAEGGPNWSGIANKTGSKGGLADVVIYNNNTASGAYFSGYNGAVVTLPPYTGATRKTNLSVGTNFYRLDEASGLYNFHIFAPHSFVEALSYFYIYDTTNIDLIYGRTDSPIRVGFSVPPHAVGLARLDFPNFSVSNSISVIDLSDSEPENLTAFSRGSFTLSADNASVSPSLLTDYKGINSGIFSGAADVVYTGEVDTSNVRVTSLAAASRDLDSPAEAFYVYLIGRGDWAVNVLDAHPHPGTGELTPTTTGEALDLYVANIEKIKSSISLSYGDGKPADDIRWDIIPCQRTPEHLDDAIKSGLDIFLDGVEPPSYTGNQYSGSLPDGNFMVVLYSDHLPSDGRTVWVSYRGYNLRDGSIDPQRKEIYNPVVAIRSRIDEVGPDMYETQLGAGSYYNLTIFGVDRTASGAIGK